jgi:hypothetical protein
MNYAMDFAIKIYKSSIDPKKKNYKKEKKKRS